MSKGVAVFLILDKAPVAGEPVRFTVKVINKQNVAKMMKVHANAQAKEYNHSPSDTFWETHGVIQLAPMEGKTHFSLICTLRFPRFSSVVWLNICLFLPQPKLSRSRSSRLSMRTWWETTWSTSP